MNLPAFSTFVLGFLLVFLDCPFINLATEVKYLASCCRLTSIWKQDAAYVSPIVVYNQCLKYIYDAEEQ